MPEMNNNNPYSSGSSFGGPTSSNPLAQPAAVDKLKEQQQQQQKSQFGFGIPTTTAASGQSLPSSQPAGTRDPKMSGFAPGAPNATPVDPWKPAPLGSSADNAKSAVNPSPSFGSQRPYAPATSFGSANIPGLNADASQPKADLPKPSFLNDKPGTLGGGFGSTAKPATEAAPYAAKPVAEPAKRDGPKTFEAKPGASSIPLDTSKSFTTTSPVKSSFAASESHRVEPPKSTLYVPSPASTPSIGSTTSSAKPFSANYLGDTHKDDSNGTLANATVTKSNSNGTLANATVTKSNSNGTLAKEDEKAKDVPMKDKPKKQAASRGTKEKLQPTRHSTRTRSAPKLAVVEAPLASKTDKKGIEVEQGSGVKFGDIPHIAKELGKRKSGDKAIMTLHRILFGRPGESSKRKANLRLFNGTSREHKDKLERLSVEDLKALAGLVNLERSGEKAALVSKLDAFLRSPKDFGETKPAPKTKTARAASRPKGQPAKRIKSAERVTATGDDEEDAASQ